MLHLRLLPALHLLHLITRTVLCINDVIMVSGLVIGYWRPMSKQSMFCPLGSKRNNPSAPLHSHSPKTNIYGPPPAPVIHRSQSSTHLDPVEDAINSSLLHYQQQIPSDDDPSAGIKGPALEDAPRDAILQFPPHDREAIGVALNVKRRLRGLANSGDCRRCWLQKRHCVCEQCVPLESNENGGIPNVNRLFLLTHHKEIGLAVDTAKLIMAAFPTTTRLVVSGIGRDFQPSMGEMLDAVSNAAKSSPLSSGVSDTSGSKCLILFPTDDAKTFAEINDDLSKKRGSTSTSTGEKTSTVNNVEDTEKGWDVVVLDGTWSQARKIHSKYFEESRGCLYRVQLSNDAVKALDGSSKSTLDVIDDGGNIGGKGHQLRRHPIKWREISTLEATRLLLNDMHTDGRFIEHSRAMARYQEIGNIAAKRQLGPPRVKP